MYLAKHLYSHQYFAIKAISKKDTQLQPVGLAQVMAEREVLSKCSSLFIVKLHSTFQDNNNFYFCLEYMGGGNLRKLFKKYKTFEGYEAVYIAAQVLLGLKYLHEEAMTMHRDLKPENVLLNEVGDLKLSDFGLAKIGLTEAFSICGTRQYFAPEQLRETGYDKKVDFWAYGCLLYELLVGKPPFADKNQARLFERIKSVSFCVNQADFDSEKIPTGHAKDLINRLLEQEPRKRIGAHGFAELMNHPFFQEVAWEDLEHGRIVSPLRGKVSASSPESMGFFELKPDEPMSLDDMAGSHLGVEVSYTAVFNPQYLDRSEEILNSSQHSHKSRITN